MADLTLPYGILLAVAANIAPHSPINPPIDGIASEVLGSARMNLAPRKLGKWREAKLRYRSHLSDITAKNDEAGTAWNHLVSQSRMMDETGRIEWVNQTLNAVRYVPDEKNWGRADYWASPVEFIARGGDCEDYALAKYRLLVESGVAADRMAVVVTKSHAVLIMATADGPIVLDNKKRKPYALKRKLLRDALFMINDRDWSVNLA